jgi:sterol desaturase/sphingolipid hydroxylase (fatty acid hydroxylase superfamily)
MGGLYFLTLGNSMQEAYLTIATLAIISLSLVMERVFPLHGDWNVSQGDITGDIGSFVFVFGVLEGALKWLSPFVILALLPDFGLASSWPLWTQIIIAMLLIEFGAWVSHWAHHTYKPLWALHAMHHSAERLYTLNNFRFHPLNHVINYLIMFLPLLVLGISAEAILGYTALTLPVLMLQHSNVGFNFGFLSYLFNTNTLHRWHHSSAYKEGMHNFGRAFVLWDHLFGTYYNPAERDEPNTVGLGSGSAPYPSSNRTFQQVLWPFSKDCCQ